MSQLGKDGAKPLQKDHRTPLLILGHAVEFRQSFRPIPAKFFDASARGVIPKRRHQRICRHAAAMTRSTTRRPRSRNGSANTLIYSRGSLGSSTTRLRAGRVQAGTQRLVRTHHVPSAKIAVFRVYLYKSFCRPSLVFVVFFAIVYLFCKPFVASLLPVSSVKYLIVPTSLYLRTLLPSLFVFLNLQI